MSKVTISDAIRYVGVDDKDIDLFESQYIVPNGVSYNSYVILDEKIAVMDTALQSRLNSSLGCKMVWLYSLLKKRSIVGSTMRYTVRAREKPI